ncbi:MAG: phenylalanine 4-monooxygenase [Bacteroidia bacterium]|nr:phenylalanine 4-monooxygenase [Bacteroidia bacterium]
MKTYPMVPGLAQHYDRYTSEDFEVWRILYERQMPHLNQVAAREYLDGIAAIDFTADRIPDFRQVNLALGDLTGWSLVVVPGIIAEPDFFRLLTQKQFPATTWLRSRAQLDYISEPDMFHDVFGHVPMLTQPAFGRFFEAIGRLGVQYINHPEIVTMLGRMYWFTAEFGLIGPAQNRRIYGAGLLSSYEESRFCLTTEPTHLAFSATSIMHHPYENDHIQDTYYGLETMDQLFESLPEMESVITSSLRLNG